MFTINRTTGTQPLLNMSVLKKLSAPDYVRYRNSPPLPVSAITKSGGPSSSGSAEPMAYSVSEPNVLAGVLEKLRSKCEANGYLAYKDCMIDDAEDQVTCKMIADNVSADCLELAKSVALTEDDGYPLDWEYHEYIEQLREISQNPRVSWWMRKAAGIIGRAMSKQHHRVRVEPEARVAKSKARGGFPAPGVSGQ